MVDPLGELERDPPIGHELRGRLTGERSDRIAVDRVIDGVRDAKSIRVIAIWHRGGDDRTEALGIV